LINLSEPENLVELRNQILSKLFKWLILSNLEFKESGAANVALKLNGLFKLTDDPKCLCLSLLLREVRSINASIRETSEKASQDDELQINQARMIEIQKQTNKVFIGMFKRWITTEEKAKMFMLEMPGVDFIFESFG
jgi:uncharacterized Zn finger protein